MAWTADDVRRLERAIATGAREVVFSDQRVTYQTVSAMREALSQMRREVNPPTTPRVFYPVVDKGL